MFRVFAALFLCRTETPRRRNNLTLSYSCFLIPLSSVPSSCTVPFLHIFLLLFPYPIIFSSFFLCRSFPSHFPTLVSLSHYLQFLLLVPFLSFTLSYSCFLIPLSSVPSSCTVPFLHIFLLPLLKVLSSMHHFSCGGK
jgi:hypothetical protein